MNHENGNTLNTESILENLTRTLLYEGYSLYPYHRSAIKNQKPIPFGVVFPCDYNNYNVHAHSNMQTQCIVIGSDDLVVNINVRFLHLRKTELFENPFPQEAAKDEFVPAVELTINDKCYQAGWQTIERRISTGDLPILSLLENSKVIPIGFHRMTDTKYIYDENGRTAAKQFSSISEISGSVIIEAAPVENIRNAFRVTVSITNTTPVENAETVTRDKALSRSFLSTHTILATSNGQFISLQDPGDLWKGLIEKCRNINTWPILIDEMNTTLLSSPIILYDHPQINPKSAGNLFDSTEIEEALLLHVAVLSDEEKKRIAGGDGKLQAMLDKVKQVTPEELIGFHSNLEYNEEQVINDKKSTL